MASATTLWHCHSPLSSSSSSFRRTLKQPTILSRVRIHSIQSPRNSSRRPSRTLSSLASPPCAYVTGPASDPNFVEPDPKIDGSTPEETEPPPRVITWELLSMLLMKHKLRIAVSVASLFACTTCTLSMPIFSGNCPLSPSKKNCL